MAKDRLYDEDTENLATGRKMASAAKPEVLVDYDDGVNKAHANLQAAKAVGLYNEDFYRGFCACLQGFGRARRVGGELNERT